MITLKEKMEKKRKRGNHGEYLAGRIKGNEKVMRRSNSVNVVVELLRDLVSSM